jgi:hypothetical protein
MKEYVSYYYQSYPMPWLHLKKHTMQSSDKVFFTNDMHMTNQESTIQSN